MNNVYTIGYEGAEIDDFVRTLKAAGIAVLADVRAVANSRKKGFSKTALRARLESEGISYIHFVELGDPKDGRVAARAGRYADFRKIYSEHLSGAEAQIALCDLSETIHKNPTCLLCFERSPKHCHRSIVADRVMPSGTKVFHLIGNDPKRYERNAASLTRRHSGQGVATTEQTVW